jgi:YgiT-type zinc finger domain-containing protein
MTPAESSNASLFCQRFFCGRHNATPYPGRAGSEAVSRLSRRPVPRHCSLDGQRVISTGIVEKKSVKELMISSCSECGGRLKRKALTQEFEREGVKVKLSGFKAWTCSRCGEIYFEAGGAEKAAQAVNCLFALAFAERQREGTVIARISQQRRAFL